MQKIEQRTILLLPLVQGFHLSASAQLLVRVLRGWVSYATGVTSPDTYVTIRNFKAPPFFTKITS